MVPGTKALERRTPSTFILAAAFRSRVCVREERGVQNPLTSGI
jgi:hypothetical protein